MEESLSSLDDHQTPVNLKLDTATLTNRFISSGSRLKDDRGGHRVTASEGDSTTNVTEERGKTHVCRGVPAET